MVYGAARRVAVPWGQVKWGEMGSAVWILFEQQQLLLGLTVGCSDGKLVKQLAHEAREPLEGARDADLW